ncbi:hypothetical protein [Noviluteimonas lactosilytica]|nr:hypothetical protein [Lysobacter lactosilyticus]
MTQTPAFEERATGKSFRAGAPMNVQATRDEIDRIFERLVP